MTESAATSLESVSVLRAPRGEHIGGEMSFETLLRRIFSWLFIIMDYMNHRRAPKARTNELQLAFSSTWVEL